jgi:hypothetical protein
MFVFVTEEEAAAMYARRCWYGTKAKLIMRAKIRALKAKADDKGVEAWERVGPSARPANLPIEVRPDQTHPWEQLNDI